MSEYEKYSMLELYLVILFVKKLELVCIYKSENLFLSFRYHDQSLYDSFLTKSKCLILWQCLCKKYHYQLFVLVVPTLLR